MKASFIVPVLVATGLVAPVLRQPKTIAKKASPEYVRQANVESARIARALSALRKGDVVNASEVRETIAHLHKGDFRRPTFAALLDRRGETRTAFELERTRVHFMEASVPDDDEMKLYADLATRVGCPDEAAWARERMGAEGHYRVWRRTEERVFSRGRAFATTPEIHDFLVNKAMDQGNRLHPSFRGETEALRRKLLRSP